MEVPSIETADTSPCRGDAYHAATCHRALHVRSLRLYEEFHRDAHAKSPPSKLLEIVARCKALVGSSSQRSDVCARCSA